MSWFLDFKINVLREKLKLNQYLQIYKTKSKIFVL